MSEPRDSQIGGDHYRRGKTQPFDLIDSMESSGSTLADYSRGCVIKYAFRKKGDISKMIEDLEKAGHYAQTAIRALRARQQDEQQPQLPLAVDPGEICKICGKQGDNAHTEICPKYKERCTCSGVMGLHAPDCVFYEEGAQPPPKNPASFDACLNCGKPCLSDSPYCAICRLNPGPR